MERFPSGSLIFDQKIRGHLPVTRFAVSEVGSVTVAVPDPEKPRLYRLGRLSLGGEWQDIGGFSVETVTSWDVSVSGSALTAAAKDALYVFSAGEKIRLLRDRRDIYIESTISAAGDLVAAISSDMLMSAYSLTVASADGRIIGARDLPYALACGQMAPDGSAIAVGSEEGVVVLLDHDRRTLWQFDLGEPVTRVCVEPLGGRVIVGTSSGRVAALADGEKVWESVGRGPVTACAVAEGGGMTVVARDDERWGIECLSAEGRVVFEHGAPSMVAAVACSADGRYTALSCRDGTLQILETEPGTSRLAYAGQSSVLYANALDLAGGNSLGDAVKMLTRALDLDPTNLDAARSLSEIAHSLVRELLRSSELSLASGSIAEGAARLMTAWEHLMLAPDLVDDVLAARKRLSDEILSHAAETSCEDAVDLLRVLLRLDVTNVEARRLLGRTEKEIADRLMEAADQALGDGRPSEAVRLLEEACEHAPTDAVRERLNRARCASALADGIALYEAGEYPQAITQFRRALAIEPGNAEASRHLAYAEKLAANDEIFDRFSKLE